MKQIINKIREIDTTLVMSVLIVLLGILNICCSALIRSTNKKLEEINERVETLESEYTESAIKVSVNEDCIYMLEDKIDNLIDSDEMDKKIKECIEDYYAEANTEEVIADSVSYVPTVASDNNGYNTQAPEQSDEPYSEDGQAYDSELWYMYEVVEAETHGCDQESKMHVAHVIMNRVNSPLFPNTITQVCLQSGQFVLRSDVEQSTIDAVNYALTIGDTTGGALYFHSGGYTETFSGASYIFTDSCGHHFYTK